MKNRVVRKILYAGVVLLIAVALIFSTVAVTADKYNSRQDTKSVDKGTEHSSELVHDVNAGIIGMNQIFYEDFDSGVWPSEGFPIVDNDYGSPETWGLDTNDYHTSPNSAGVFWAWPPPCQSEWLISKKITIPANAQLKFFSYVYLGSTSLDEFKVKISPNGSTNHDDFVTIWDATNEYPPDTGWHYFSVPSFIIDLSEYGPDTVRIAFHADGSTFEDCALWYIWLVDTVSINTVNAPLTPPIIDGPTSGKPGIEYKYTFTAASPEEHDVYYYIDWGDGTFEEWIGPYNSGLEVTIGHIWDREKTFVIKAKAKDVFDLESDWAVFVVRILEDKPPTEPFIDGPPIGKPEKELCWTFESYDENGDMVKYHIDWDDNSFETTDLVLCCEPAEVCHTYEKQGEYNLTAYAEDETGLTSGTSKIKVDIPRNRAIYNSWYHWFLERFPLLEKLLTLIRSV